MTRFFRIIVHNWPLKLGAIVLATILYAGLVLSQGAQTFLGQIPIQVRGQPVDLYFDPNLPPVTSVTYLRPEGTDTPSTSTFTAYVDLSAVEPTGGVIEAPVIVEAPGTRIQVLEVQPSTVEIRLEAIVEKVVPVTVDRGTIPEGLDLGEVRTDPETVVVTGPESIVRDVVAARANVVIQASGIDIDQDVSLLPVDALGDARSPVDVSPATARIQIPVFSDRQTRSVPVNPVVTGTPAAGFEIASITFEPSVVLVEGDADALVDLVRADTEPISTSGLSESTTFDVGLALPDGIDLVADGPVVVRVTLRPVTESRSFTAGLTLVGSRSDLIYDLSTDRVLLTVGGSPANLDGLQGSGVAGTLDVADLEPGTYDVTVTADLGSGVTLIASSPAIIVVTIAAPAAPSPSPTPTAEPPGS
jgi:YbbR domain-containing protein